MTYHVRTTVFEGPLDLLLQLVARHQVEVTALGLTQVVTEYLAFLDEMANLDIEVTSEFLLIAATLVQMKAQSLLPSPEELDLEEELELIEERDRLLSRLLACVTFKDVAAVLSRRLQEVNRVVPRISGIDEPIAPPPAVIELPVDSAGLAHLAASIIVRHEAEPDLDHLDLDLPNVEEAIADLRRRVEEATLASFESLTGHLRRPVQIAAYFVALLEMARWGLIEISQTDWLSTIEVRHREAGDVDLTSEWAR
jgi:segregation and condensation protein A